MSDSPSEPEAERASSDVYGADWDGLSRSAMAARQAEILRRMQDFHDAEEERRRRELEEFRTSALGKKYFDELEAEPAEPAEPAATAPSDSTPPDENRERSRPAPLISRLHIENLKSLSGRHDIPLAPLTLVYGQNSAGKSAVLRGLQLFMHAVKTGQHDALDLWRRAFPDIRPESVITWDPDTHNEFESWTRELALGVEYPTSKNGDTASAELRFSRSDHGPWHASAMSVGAADDPAHKEFHFNLDDVDPVLREDFGDVFPKWRAREWSGAARPEGWEGWADREVDYELFGHPNHQVQRALFRLAGQLTYFGPHRGAPDRAYTPVADEAIVGPDSWGDWATPQRSFAGFMEFELLNQMLDQLDIPHQFEPSFKAKGGEVGVSGWHLTDRRSKAPVTPDQVGYGVSQLLPIVHACILATQRVIAIEEPELHLHPRLQAKLGNLFTFSLKRGNQIIVETHSESILLRVRRLVRAGKLRPNEVAVLYVDNPDDGDVFVRRMRLGAQGELLDPWPTGFFDDSLADVLGIAE